ncbi:MAG: polyhydroxyalkanoate synthesis regulator DNA-binding domain-containing protein [Bacteroidota bacterium]
MPRLIKRYGSRKLYDTGDSRYISMQEVAGLIQSGEQIEVVDNKSGEDVTVPVLTQVISEQGRRGNSFPSSLLHDLIRAGEEALQAGEDAVTTGVRQLQQGVEGIVQKASRSTLGKLRQPSPMQDEMARLRERLDALETSLGRLAEDQQDRSNTD